MIDFFYLRLVAYFLCFFVIWYGAGLAISTITYFAKKINLSTFSVSFFLLGLLTSLPELFVGVNAIIDKDPEIYVGNLLGGIVVIFLFIIPVLAILNNGIVLDHNLDQRKLLITLTAIIAPSFMISDRQISFFESIFLIIFYLVLIYFLERKKSLLEKVHDQIFQQKNHFFYHFGRLILGVVMLLVASNYLVDQTIYLSNKFGFSPFVVSLIILAIGTNLPELSLAVRSVIAKKEEVAFGDYVGSAAANSFLIGFLTILNGGSVVVDNGYIKPFIFTFIGLVIFFLFSRTKNDISRKEGLALIIVYIFFLISEVF